ncbi:hypothetical protein IU11_01045 [Cellulosimicrobium sp. MM]|nr:hypothetical protein IU11_01045 [Cellulosimicrobium sp. MM]
MPVVAVCHPAGVPVVSGPISGYVYVGLNHSGAPSASNHRLPRKLRASSSPTASSVKSRRIVQPVPPYRTRASQRARSGSSDGPRVTTTKSEPGTSTVQAPESRAGTTHDAAPGSTSMLTVAPESTMGGGTASAGISEPGGAQCSGPFQRTDAGSPNASPSTSHPPGGSVYVSPPCTV